MRHPPILIPSASHSHIKNEVDSGDVQENKRGRKCRCQVSGVRCQRRSPKSETASGASARLGHSGSRLLAHIYCSSNMKVTPGMFMKTNEEEKCRCQVSGASGEARSQKPLAALVLRLDILAPDSSLLLFKYEGDSGDVHENKRGRKCRCQVSGASGEARSQKPLAALVLGLDILAPDSSLLLFKYEGDSGDIIENNGSELARCSWLEPISRQESAKSPKWRDSDPLLPSPELLQRSPGV